MSRLELLDGTTWEPFVAAPRAVLMLAKTGCGACQAWTDELTAALTDASAFAGVRFGKLILDQGGLAGFKRASPWLKEVEDLPYTVIFRDGQIAKRFAGGGLARLSARLARLDEEGGSE